MGIWGVKGREMRNKRLSDELLCMAAGARGGFAWRQQGCQSAVDQVMGSSWLTVVIICMECLTCVLEKDPIRMFNGKSFTFKELSIFLRLLQLCDCITYLWHIYKDGRKQHQATLKSKITKNEDIFLSTKRFNISAQFLWSNETRLKFLIK